MQDYKFEFFKFSCCFILYILVGQPAERTLAHAQLLQVQFEPHVLEQPEKLAVEQIFEVIKVPVYNPITDTLSAFLIHGYAASTIKNPDALRCHSKRKITGVSFVFSQYPVDKKDWLTDYNTLLAERVKALLAICPEANDAHIHWQIVLQTNCKTEAQAKALPHGIYVEWEELPDLPVEQSTPALLPPAKLTAVQKDSAKLNRWIEKQIRKDKNLKRVKIPELIAQFDTSKTMLVVMDYSGSMYAYTAELLQWHNKLKSESPIDYLVLFTDSDPAKSTRKTGKRGGIYFVDASDTKATLAQLRTAQDKTFNNREQEENNVEALLKAMRRYPKAEQVIMVADNRSCMCDFVLARQIGQPVHTILCATEWGINPQYLNLALYTGGTVSTAEWHVDFSKHHRPDTIHYEQYIYHYDHALNRYENLTELNPLIVQNCAPFYPKWFQRRKKNLGQS